MKFNNTKWELKKQPDEAELSSLQKELDCSRIFAILSYQRGIKSQKDLENFVRPNIDSLHDPYDLYGMNDAVKRIETAVLNNEKITIYGDYDADGVTSTTILVETLLMLGARVDYYIPNRFTEGYGPNISAFKKIIESGTTLIITVDNGVQGHESIKYANEENIDVIITDHHELPEKLPDALAVIHPKHPNGNYSFDDLSGAGVAFKLASAILGDVPYDLLDLAAIGTVADLVSLTGENRIITMYGLQAMKQTERLGLLSLLQVTDTKPGDVDETTIGFRIGPRLNAAGRMGDASIAVDLLLAQDIDTAKTLANELDKLNQTRKTYVEDITEEIKDQLEEFSSEYINVIAGENWHEGVIGIVASRVVEFTNKPTLILSIDKDKELAKGSGRSIASINLFEVLNQFSDLMTAFGGHHMAAGLTVPIKNIDSLRQNVNQYIANHYEEEERENIVTIDAKAELNDITIDSIKEVESLAPFGTDNDQPKIVLYNVTAQNMKKIGSNKTHLKTMFRDESSEQTIDAVGFGHGEMVDRLGSSPIIDVVCTANINEWNGNRKAQLMIEEIGVSRTQIIDRRSRHFPSDIYGLSDTAYIFFSKQVYNAVVDIYSQQENFYLYDDGINILEDKLVFVDCPPNQTVIKKVLQTKIFDIIYAVFFSFEEVYLNGLANRKEFETVYRYIMTHKNIDYKNKRKQLADYLQLNLNVLNFIIFVFLEVEYVKMDNGLLYPTNNHQTINIKETKTYQKRLNLMQMEKQLLYSSDSELTQLLNSWIKVED